MAQIELALVLLDLDLGLSFDVFSNAGASNFALHTTEQELQSLADVQALQNLVLVRDLEVQVGCREIGEPARIGDVHLENRRHLVRDALDQLGEGFGTGDDARDQVIDFIRIGRYLLRWLDTDDGERIGLYDAFDDDATQALKCDLNGVAREIDSFVHSGRDADTAHEALGIEHVIVVAAGDDQPDDQAGMLIGLEQGKVLRRAHLNGDGAEWVDDGRSKRHQRQCRWYVSLQDVVFTLGGRHSVPLERLVASVVSEVNGA